MVEPVTIKVDGDGELGRALREQGSAVVLNVEGVRYRVSCDHVFDHNELDDPQREPNDHYSILRLVGMGSSSGPSDIARFKDQYIAEAIFATQEEIPMERRFTIEVEQDEESGWFVGEVLELPGCYSQAPDMPALHANVYEAIVAYLRATEPETDLPSTFVQAWRVMVPA